jgi:hypothetical protein
MIYVFDTSSLSKLKHFYPTVFKTLWDGLDTLVKSGNLISTREVWNELERGAPDKNVNAWLKDRRKNFYNSIWPRVVFCSSDPQCSALSIVNW